MKVALKRLGAPLQGPIDAKLHLQLEFQCLPRLLLLRLLFFMFCRLLLALLLLLLLLLLLPIEMLLLQLPKLLLMLHFRLRQPLPCFRKGSFNALIGRQRPVRAAT